MANYCWNSVIIEGDSTVLAKLETLFNTYDDSDYLVDWGNTFFPYMADKPTHDEYTYYGTKWWEFTCTLTSDNTLQIDGDSAWGPPLKLVELISSFYSVNCKIQFSEPGSGFAGKYEWDSGTLIENTDYNYAQYIYEEEDGLDSLIREYLYEADAIDSYANSDEFINCVDVSISAADKVILDNFFKENKKPMLDKEKTLEELSEIETHLKNLSMNGLAKKVTYMIECLTNEWKKDE